MDLSTSTGWDKNVLEALKRHGTANSVIDWQKAKNTRIEVNYKGSQFPGQAVNQVVTSMMDLPRAEQTAVRELINIAEKNQDTSERLSIVLYTRGKCYFSKIAIGEQLEVSGDVFFPKYVELLIGVAKKEGGLFEGQQIEGLTIIHTHPAQGAPLSWHDLEAARVFAKTIEKKNPTFGVTTIAAPIADHGKVIFRETVTHSEKAENLPKDFFGNRRLHHSGYHYQLSNLELVELRRQPNFLASKGILTEEIPKELGLQQVRKLQHDVFMAKFSYDNFDFQIPASQQTPESISIVLTARLLK